MSNARGEYRGLTTALVRGINPYTSGDDVVLDRGVKSVLAFTKISNERQWWSGWRELFLNWNHKAHRVSFRWSRLLELYHSARTIEIPRIVRKSSMDSDSSSSGHAPTFPNQEFINLNRDLPKLPDRISLGSTLSTGWSALDVRVTEKPSPSEP
jgi:hypothetical protein